jgi:C-terminal processing protease CtpA/Prc
MVESEAGAPAVVTSVEPGGPAARAGFVVGDIVTAVDGIDVTGRYGGDARMLLEGIPGASITVTVKRGLTATIVLEP